MANHLIIVTLFLLCQYGDIQIFCNGEQQTEPSNVEHQTKASDHAQSTTILGHENHTMGSGSHHEQHATDKPHDNSGESEDTSIHQPESTALNETTKEQSNNTYRPNFRRYVDLRKNLPIIEKRVDNTWVRERPPLAPGETPEVNISRYAYFANGSRIPLRSKFDYSFDDVHWFRSSRIKIPISQFANGTTIFQYRYGPKRWLSDYRNRIFRNDSTMFYQELGPGQNIYHFDQDDSFFRPPPSKDKLAIDHSFNGTVSRRRQVYQYGPPTMRNAGPGMHYRRYGRPYYNRWFDYYNYRYPHYQFYNDRRWGQRNKYYNYYPYRPPYNDPRYLPNDPYYNSGRLDRQGDGGYYDRRYPPAGTYDNGVSADNRYHYPNVDQRYYSGPSDGRYRNDGMYDDKKYQSNRVYDDKQYHPDGTYDDRKYQTDRTYNDKRYYHDNTYADRKYPPEATYNNPRNRAYDTRGPDQTPNYDGRRLDQGYEDTYNRRRDR